MYRIEQGKKSHGKRGWGWHIEGKGTKALFTRIKSPVVQQEGALEVAFTRSWKSGHSSFWCLKLPLNHTETLPYLWGSYLRVKEGKEGQRDSGNARKEWQWEVRERAPGWGPQPAEN